MLASTIEHTLLRPDAVAKDFDRCAEEAQTHGFLGICVPTSWVAHCHKIRPSSRLRIVTVVGFPLGVTTAASKAFEAGEARHLGADEIDTVIHRGKLLAGDHRAVEADLSGVVRAAEGAPVKVIVEAARLERRALSLACQLAEAAGATFIKTSTGFAGGGARLADVEWIREQTQGRVAIKASGGIRNRGFAEALLAAGATRLGTSASVALIADGGQEKDSDGDDRSY